MASVPTFKGFSTVSGLQTLYDINLIKQDILNNIYTKKGEKLMDPEYGSIIWDLLFENKSALILSEIENDLQQIVNNEPRVQLLQLKVIEQEHGYIGLLDLYFVNSKTSDQLKLSFNTNVANAGQNQAGI